MPVTLLRHRCDVQHADDLGYSNGIETTSENLWFLTMESCYCHCGTYSDSRLHRVAKPESAAVIVSALCAVRGSDKLMLESVFVCLQAIVLFNTRYCSYTLWDSV